MVDAHVDAACIFRDGIAEQLDARHVHGYRVAGRELACVQADVHIIIPGRDGVRAQHGHCFAQALQRPVQRGGAADGVAVRVFMTDQQHVFRFQQPAQRCRDV